MLMSKVIQEKMYLISSSFRQHWIRLILIVHLSEPLDSNVIWTLNWLNIYYILIWCWRVQNLSVSKGGERMIENNNNNNKKLWNWVLLREVVSSVLFTLSHFQSDIILIKKNYQFHIFGDKLHEIQTNVHGKV